MHGSTQLEDLHWHYDAISRLGEAQSLAYTLGLQQKIAKHKPYLNKQTNALQEKLDHRNFIRPGVFWWAFDWQSAEQYSDKNSTQQTGLPSSLKQWDEKKQGVVLLIDEIDKAEPDLPNGLLQTLGDLEFKVPYINKKINVLGEKPLIIITTNEERELPTALIRRCYTHTLKMPDSETDRINWLVKRGKLHFQEDIAEPCYQLAAELLWQDRNSNMRYPPRLSRIFRFITQS